MVNTALKYESEEVKATKDPIFLPSPVTYGSVSIAQMVKNNHRFDASAYNIKAMNALRKVVRNRYGFIQLYGDKGLIKKAYYPGRYKRIYNNSTGVPFFLPSQLEEIYPKPQKYISPKTAALLHDDIVKENTLLLSRSGTIGKCTVASRTTIGKLFSDDVIRISFKQPYYLGYVYAFLNTDIGLTILQSNNYGAVIDHIEPEHLNRVPIPNAPDNIKQEIHNLIIESFDLRDQSNDLIDKAQQLLYQELQLPDINDIHPKYHAENTGFRNFVVKVSNLHLRFDASYHLPNINDIIELISKNAEEVTTVGDPRISNKIILAGVFKRHYVDSKFGVPFLGGRDMMQLNPKVEKYLSKELHKDRIRKELEVFENYVLVSDRGTIGKVQIVPKHWNNWAVSQNVIKIIPRKGMEGYLYAYLSSNYALALIRREIYGSVVDMIDNNSISAIPIPLLKDKHIQKTINDYVLRANDMRYQAYLKEQDAINKMNEILTAN